MNAVIATFSKDGPLKGLRGVLVVSLLNCYSRGSRFKSRSRQRFLIALANSGMMGIHCQCEDETARERPLALI